MQGDGKVIIGLDLDGVVYDWDRTARYMIRRHIEERGEKPAPELYQSAQDWNWIKRYTPSQDWKWLWSDEGIEHGVYRYGNVITGAIEGVRELTSLGDVVAITARPKNAVHDTLAWLAMFFDKSPLAGIVIQSDGQHKSDVMPTPDVYLDDGPHNLEDLLDHTPSYVVQYVQPWNQHWLPRPDQAEHWLRATNWREVVSKVTWAKERCLVNTG